MAKKENDLFSLKKKVFLSYPYYWPHYKAGGPVQSLYNLTALFDTVCEFYLISLSKDIDGSESSITFIKNEWNNGLHGERIYYVDKITFKLVKTLIFQIQPDVIFVNGIFNINTTVPAIYYGKIARIKTIISPRGMLQSWGLKRNKLMKTAFLCLLRMALKQDEWWHATDAQERSDIIRHFGINQRVHVASNIPKNPGVFKKIDFDKTKKIKLVFLSLINPNKNLHILIDAVLQNNMNFTLDIYGPVIDKKYWSMCETKMQNCPSIVYRGSVLPWKVNELLQDYHFFVLPTQGENFGHAIFDSLASGVPVIISKNTPWRDLEKENAGIYIDLENPRSLNYVLNNVRKLTPNEYQVLRKNSLKYAELYWESMTYKRDYEFLIDIHMTQIDN